MLKKHAANAQWTDFLLYQFGRSPTKIRQTTMRQYKPRTLRDLADVPYYPYVTGHGGDLLEYFTYYGTSSVKKRALIAWKSIMNEPAELQRFLVDALCRDVDLKVTPRQINSVYGPDTVADFHMMNSVTFFGNEHNIRARAYTIRPIVDGLRCIAIKEQGDIIIYTRHGIMLEGFDLIVKGLHDIPYDDVVFDGTIAYEGPDSVDMKGFDLACKAICTSRSSVASRKDFVFCIYDVIDVDEFKKRETTKLFKDRCEFLETNFVDNEYVKLVRSIFKGTRVSNILKYYKQERAAGKTGVFVNLDHEPYALKGQKVFFKVAEMQDADLMIMDYELDHDKEFLKCIIVDFKDSRVKISNGFTDEERRWYYKHGDDLLGRIANITFLMIKQKADRTGYWLPGGAFSDLLPPGSPIRYNVKEYGVTIDDEE